MQPKCAPMAVPFVWASLHADRRTAVRAIERFQTMTVAAAKGQNVPLTVVRVVITALPACRERDGAMTPKAVRARENRRKKHAPKEWSGAGRPEAPKSETRKRTSENERTGDSQRASACPHEPGRDGDAFMQ